MKPIFKLLLSRPYMVVLFVFYSPFLAFAWIRHRFFAKRYEDEQFGRFILDDELSTFDGKGHWQGRIVHLSVPVNDEDAPEKPHMEALDVLRALWCDEREWHSRITSYITAEYQPLKNSNWLDEGEREVSVEEFKDRIRVESIAVRDDGRFEFWFDDGGLFLGHSLVVRANLHDGITGKDFAG